MSDMVERIGASWRGLMEAIAGIPDARLAEPGVAGDWSVKDVLAHIAFWEDQLVEQIDRRMSGTPQPDDEGDVEVTNAREYEARRDWTVERVRDDLLRGHERMLTSLRAVPDIPAGDVEGDTWEHYDDHATDIRRWREQMGI